LEAVLERIADEIDEDRGPVAGRAGKFQIRRALDVHGNPVCRQSLAEGATDIVQTLPQPEADAGRRLASDGDLPEGVDQGTNPGEVLPQ